MPRRVESFDLFFFGFRAKRVQIVFHRKFLLTGLALLGGVALAGCSIPPTPQSTVILSAPSTSTPPASPSAKPLPTSAYVEATPRAPVNIQGTYVYSAGDGSLWLQAANGGDPTALVERSTESLAQLPSYSPDGKQIAYSALLFLPNDDVRGDIRRIDADGKNQRTFLHAAANDIVYMYPRFAADGRMLVTRAENLQTTSERAQLEWVSASGQESAPFIHDARDADVSHDGKQIAFIRYNVQTMRYGLWLADAAGENEKALLTDDTFSAIMAPRFAPDDRWLAFGVHGAQQKDLPLVAKEDCAVKIFVLCLVETAYAHMAPGALWRVNVATGKFEQLTAVYDDSPVPAWSRDGTRIAIHDFTGIRLIDLPLKEIYPLFLEDGGIGGFDWWDSSR